MLQIWARLSDGESVQVDMTLALDGDQLSMDRIGCLLAGCSSLMMSSLTFSRLPIALP